MVSTRISLSGLFILNVLISSFTTVAQFPPTPENVTTITSRFDDRITISYKEVRVLHLLPALTLGVDLLTLFTFSPAFAKLHRVLGRMQGT